MKILTLGGLIAGTLDLIYICAFWSFRDVGAVAVLHGVAAGWTGRDAAVAGGSGTALLGLATHYTIAIVMACVYGFAAQRRPQLARRPVLFGALYGVILYFTMNYIVVPLSAAGTGLPVWSWVQLPHLGAHMLLVGVPCALAARMALHAR